MDKPWNTNETEWFKWNRHGEGHYKKEAAGGRSAVRSFRARERSIRRDALAALAKKEARRGE